MKFMKDNGLWDVNLFLYLLIILTMLFPQFKNLNLKSMMLLIYFVHGCKIFKLG